MKETSEKIIKLLFDPGEEICVSHNEFAYYSIKQEEIGPEIRLVSNNGEYVAVISEDDINLISINPIAGPRSDSHVTSFRSFLIEMDDGKLDQQKKYIENSGIPYSACIFSGNKSLHFAITLDKPVNLISTWRMYNEWILNILKKVDQQTKNPSRCLRFPGNKRKDGKKKVQKLVELKNRVSRDELNTWLAQYPELKPKLRIDNPHKIHKSFSPDQLPQWIRDYYDSGVDTERNKTWFNIACWFAEFGDWDADKFINMWDNVFVEESDFKRREWETTVKSAFKRIQGSM